MPASTLADDVLRYYSDPAHVDPIPIFQRLLGEDPVHRSPAGFWVIADHESASYLLHQRKGVRRLRAVEDGSAMDFLFQKFISYQEPPDHTRVRRLVTQAFSPKRLEALRPVAEERTRRCIDRALVNGGMDLVKEFAAVVPTTIFCDMMGIPLSDQTYFTELMDGWVPGMQPSITPAVMHRANECAQAYMDYMQALISDRRKTPGDDMTSALIAARDDSNSLSEHELLSMVCHIFFAGVDTTTNGVALGVLRLLQHEDQWHRLRNDPQLIASAVEELIRFDGPAPVLGTRDAVEDVQLGEALIREGEAFTVWAGAANRDPRVFDHPNELDIARQPNPHLGFGTGIHFCLGAQLARMEMRIMIGEILRRCPGIQLANDDIAFKDHVTPRGLWELPVVC